MEIMQTHSTRAFKDRLFCSIFGREEHKSICSNYTMHLIILITLLNSCKSLYHYVEYVSKVKDNLNAGLPKDLAINDVLSK